MKAGIGVDALRDVTPRALVQFAEDTGWSRSEPYRGYSTVYVADDLPEIILPDIQDLGDYPQVVWSLLGKFANVHNCEPLDVYRDLMTIDHDVVRVRVDEGDSIPLGSAPDLIGGVRAMLIATTCSLRNPQAVYLNTKSATPLVNQVRMGHTEPGSYVVVLHTPVVSPRTEEVQYDNDDHDAPLHRQMTRRLDEALTTTREALESGRLTSDRDVLDAVVSKGVSANLCDSLVGLIGTSVSSLSIGVTWAKTRPVRSRRKVAFRFGRSDVDPLSTAASLFRETVPIYTQLVGVVTQLRRPESESDGNITLRAIVPRTGETVPRSVTASLSPSDYDLAIQAHRTKTNVTVTGALGRVGKRWHLRDPSITGLQSTFHEPGTLSPDDTKPSGLA